MKGIFLGLLLIQAAILFSQTSVNLQTGSKPAAGHYQRLGLLDRKANPAQAWMDTIIFPLHMNPTGILAATKMRTIFLLEDVPSLLIITPPPANSSVQTRAELDFLLDLQAKRTPAEIERYKKLAGIFHSPNNFNVYDPDYDRNFSSLFHVGSPLGNWYNYKNLPVTAAFLSDVYRDATYYFFRLKLSIKRPRPYMLEQRLEVLEKPPHPAYPSGHSAASYINAYIMMEIAPELADAFIQQAAEMAYSREVLGVHYPSDSEIGRVWARAFVNELFQKENFRQEFERVKKEILEYRKQFGNNGKTKIDTNEKGSCAEPCESSCGSCSSGCCKNNE